MTSRTIASVSGRSFFNAETGMVSDATTGKLLDMSHSWHYKEEYPIPLKMAVIARLDQIQETGEDRADDRSLFDRCYEHRLSEEAHSKRGNQR